MLAYSPSEVVNSVSIMSISVLEQLMDSDEESGNPLRPTLCQTTPWQFGVPTSSATNTIDNDTDLTEAATTHGFVDDDSYLSLPTPSADMDVSDECAVCERKVKLMPLPNCPNCMVCVTCRLLFELMNLSKHVGGVQRELITHLLVVAIKIGRSPMGDSDVDSVDAGRQESGDPV